MIFGPELAVAAAAAFVAGLSRGFSGFGAALVLMPVMAIIYGPVQSVVMLTLMEVPATAFLLPSFARRADWRAVMPLGLASIATIPLGAWILVALDAELLQQAIAVLVLVFAALLASGWRYRRPPTMPVLLGVGGAAGLIGGAANMSGPLVVVFLLAGGNAAFQVRAGIMAFFAFATFIRVGVYAAHDLYVAETVLLSAVLAMPYLIGIWTGSRLFRGVSERGFRMAVLILISVMGVVALVW